MLPPEHIDPRIWIETKIYSTADNQKLKILQTLTKEVDVNTVDYLENAEDVVMTFSKQTNATILKELVKKKKKFWLAYVFYRIKNWLKMGKKKFRYAVGSARSGIIPDNA